MGTYTRIFKVKCSYFGHCKFFTALCGQTITNKIFEIFNKQNFQKFFCSYFGLKLL